MKFLIQRVKKAQVDIDGQTVGRREKGFLVLIGITHTDTKETADYLIKKLTFGIKNFTKIVTIH